MSGEHREYGGIALLAELALDFTSWVEVVETLSWPFPAVFVPAVVLVETDGLPLSALMFVSVSGADCC